jgi:hypothetical protein
MLDYKELCENKSWRQIVELCEQQGLDVPQEIVRLIVFVRNEWGHDPLEEITKSKWYPKYKEGIEKYLLLI